MFDKNDVEPSEEWKKQLKKQIEEEMAISEAIARAVHQDDLRLGKQSEDKLKALAEYHMALKNIRILAEEQYRRQLELKRQERRREAAIVIEKGRQKELVQKLGKHQPHKPDSEREAPEMASRGESTEDQRWEPAEQRGKEEEDGRRQHEMIWSAQQADYFRMDEKHRRKQRDRTWGTESASTSTSFQASTSPSPPLRPATPGSNSPGPFPGVRPVPAWEFWTPAPSKSSSSQGSANVARAQNTSLTNPHHRSFGAVPHKPTSVSERPTFPVPDGWQLSDEEDYEDARGRITTPARRAKTPAGGKANRDPISTKIQSMSSLRAEVLRVCSTKKSYRAMLATGGSEAQRWLDTLQLVLDNGTPSDQGKERRSLIKALLRLSVGTSLYPKCLQLNHQVHKSKEPVDEGSFGDVYRGTIGTCEVAIKVFRMNQRTDISKLMKTIWREAILWCQLYHANVLPCYGVHHLSSELHRVGLVSPWLESGNVMEYLRKNPNVERLLLLADIAAGMSYLHQSRIVHGDLKGANILVSSAGRACLADFGLSTLSDPALVGWTSVRTTAGKAGGTVRWQAPELLNADEDVDIDSTTESDIYSYGCVCYEIMTGKLPFDHIKNNFAVWIQVQGGARPKKPTLEDLAFREFGLTEPLWDLIEACWHQHPGQRPTARDVYSNPLLHSLVDRRPLQEWGDVSASEFRRRLIDTPA